MQENMTEKVSVNMNIATLSQIDLLVDSGYYSNRSDFINQAVRQGLDSKQNVIDRLIGQASQLPEDNWFLGVYGVERPQLEQAAAQKKKLRIRGYGLLVIGKDCPDELVISAVESLKVRGRIVCSDTVRKHFELK